MTQEQRNHPRLVINREFETIQEFLSEYVSNVSRGGVFIRTRTPLEIGARVTLRFSILLDDFETIEGEGEVVRIVDDGDNSGMGVRFTALSERSRALLERLTDVGSWGAG